MTKSKLLTQFNKEYNFILQNDGNVSGMREAILWFESNYDGILPTIQSLVRERGEMIDTSNEKASFAFACDVLGIY